MNSPRIDRSSQALSKQVHAKIRAEAEREMKRSMQSLTASERRKLQNLLRNIKYLGDVGKAAHKTRVSRALLDKWMNTPGISWHVGTAFNEAQYMLHSGATPDDVLFRAKIAPELKADFEYFKMTGQRNRESKVIAKFAAQDLKSYRWHIVQAANNADKHFFIDLGRILSGDASAEHYDKLDEAIVSLWVKNPELKTPRIVAELEMLGHFEVNEATIRQRKKRLGLSKSVRRKL